MTYAPGFMLQRTALYPCVWVGVVELGLQMCMMALVDRGSLPPHEVM